MVQRSMQKLSRGLKDAPKCPGWESKGAKNDPKSPPRVVKGCQNEAPDPPPGGRGILWTAPAVPSLAQSSPRYPQDSDTIDS